jgi:hypothetical protein
VVSVLEELVVLPRPPRVKGRGRRVCGGQLARTSHRRNRRVLVCRRGSMEGGHPARRGL